MAASARHDAGPEGEDRHTAFRVIAMQLVVVTALALAVGVGWAPRHGWSLLAGGLIAVVPGLYMASRVFGRRRQESPRRVLAAFYLGEVGKLVLTAALFAFVFVNFEVVALAVFAGYLVAVSVYWFALLAIGRRYG